MNISSLASSIAIPFASNIAIPVVLNVGVLAVAKKFNSAVPDLRAVAIYSLGVELFDVAARLCLPESTIEMRVVRACVLGIGGVFGMSLTSLCGFRKELTKCTLLFCVYAGLKA